MSLHLRQCLQTNKQIRFILGGHYQSALFCRKDKHTYSHENATRNDQQSTNDASGSELLQNLTKKVGNLENVAVLPFHQKSQLVRASLNECNNDLYPHRHEKPRIAGILNITEKQLDAILSGARQDWRDLNVLTKKDTPEQESEQILDAPRRRSQIKSMHTQHIREWFELNNHKMPSLKERDELSVSLGLTQRQVYNQFMKQKYLHESRQLLHTEGQIGTDGKEHLLNWLKSHPRPPSTEEKQRLIQETGMNVLQLNKQIYAFFNTPGVMTQEKKDYILQWLRDHNKRQPNEDEKHALMQHTGLSRPQVTDLCRRALQPTGTLNVSLKRKIRIWMSEVGNPTRAQIRDMAADFGIAEGQLYHQVNYIRNESNGITPERKAIIMQWFREHDFRLPTQEERKWLEAQTQLGPKRLNNFIQTTFVEPPGRLNQEAHKKIVHFLKENDFLLPTTEQRARLKKSLGLNAAQLSQSISDHLQHPEHISEESSSAVRWWLDEHCPPFTIPTLAQLQDLYASLPRNHPVQINVCIHKCLTQRGDFDSTKEQPVEETVQRLLGANRSPLDAEELRVKVQICTGLNRRKVTAMLRKIGV